MRIGLLQLCFTMTLLLNAFEAWAQEKQGNIVEYFGKEKVEEIREGEVLHVFGEGLILRLNRFSLNSSSTPAAPVLSQFLLGSQPQVEAGQLFIDAVGDTASWERVAVSELNEFNDRGLRSGFLLLEYHATAATEVLFEASGHTMALINGFPHEGDHYDFGWSLIPMKLKKGRNTFLLQGGRFPRMRARLLKPHNYLAFSKRDVTMPDILKEESEELVGAIRIMNIRSTRFIGGKISCISGENKIISVVPEIAPLTVRKVPFTIPNPENKEQDTTNFSIELRDRSGNLLHEETITLSVKSKFKHHKRTFISDIDGSVQYYSIAPSSDKQIENPALFFSVHGASVEAVNQARAYQQKDWGHLVAPTNRRPFGFAWEDWGRLDALEVLEHAQNLLKTDAKRTYLTGHSMGGHGTWYLGATYPDRWAAIAPCAGYPDLLGYRDSFLKRMQNMDDQQLKRFGMTRERFKAMEASMELSDTNDLEMDAMMKRAGNPSRTLKLKRNYLHYGVYILHGEIDTVVPTFLAREMRSDLGSFHPDFTYYEYPGGTHWYGNHSVDWPPIFDYFKFRTIKQSQEIDKIEFYTASPGVSAGSHFASIYQQDIPLKISSLKYQRDSISSIITDNVSTLHLDLKQMGNTATKIEVDGQMMEVGDHSEVTLKKMSENWKISDLPKLTEKGPHRNGGFKDAFRNQLILVYGTKGNKEENQWYYQRALFDAEKFYYRANGNVTLIRDVNFDPAKYADRNVIIYGNKSNNAAWKKLLDSCPIQVSRGKLTLGTHHWEGENYGAYFVFPRPDSEVASVGVVTATGREGMKATFANHYLVNGTTFPDVTIVNGQLLTNGISGVECAGFFGNDWSVANGDFVFRNVPAN